MNFAITTYSCRKCTIPLCYEDLIERNSIAIVIGVESSIALKTFNRSNIAKCENCRESIGVKRNNTYRLYRNKIIRVTYEV